jgi:hypothetical protein
MDFRAVCIVSGCNDKDIFFDELAKKETIKQEYEFKTCNELVDFLHNIETDNIYLVLYKNNPFTVQGSFKNTSGWGRWIRFNFRKEDQGKYGIAMASESIRALNKEEFSIMMNELLEAIKEAIGE